MLDGGQSIEADLVVFATGYRGAPTVVREVLGDGRFYSKLLALQLAAIEAGTMPLTDPNG